MQSRMLGSYFENYIHDRQQAIYMQSISSRHIWASRNLDVIIRRHHMNVMAYHITEKSTVCLTARISYQQKQNMKSTHILEGGGGGGGSSGPDNDQKWRKRFHVMTSSAEGSVRAVFAADADADTVELLKYRARGNCIMTSSNENIVRVTGPLCGEFTGPRWIPRTKASDAELWCFLWSLPEPTIEQTMETPVIRDAIGLIMTSL